MDLGLKEKVALVTGGASGIGRSVCNVLAEEGANIAVVDINAEGLAQVAAEIKSHGVNAFEVVTDCSDVSQIDDAVKRVIAQYGRIDVLVNNVGGSTGTKGVSIKDIEQVGETEYNHVLDLNLKSAFFFSRAVIPHMKSQRYGKIVSVSSTAARIGLETSNVQYSAAKAGVVGFTKNMARLYGEYGINVNCIAPGSVLTSARTTAIRHDQDQDAFIKSVPLRRRSEAIEQARVIVFLCSDAASYVTGTMAVIDGGWFA